MKKLTLAGKAWVCIGIMLLGVVPMYISLFFLGKSELTLWILNISGWAIAIFGMILHDAWVRCPHCDSHIKRPAGTKCPYCGKDFTK